MDLKIWPSRTAQQKQAEVVADLDAMVAKPIAFRLHGKEHLIKAITTQEFLEYVRAAVRVSEVMNSKDATAEDVSDAAFSVIASVCSTIKRGDFDRMSQAQIGALLSLIAEHVTGRGHQDEGEKKKIAH